MAAAQRFADGLPYHFVDQFLVNKANLPFHRVDIDVNSVRVHFKKEYELRMTPFREERPIAVIDGVEDCCVLDRTTIDKQFLRTSSGTRVNRTDREALQPRPWAFSPHLHRLIQEPRAIDLQDTIPIGQIGRASCRERGQTTGSLEGAG